MKKIFIKFAPLKVVSLSLCDISHMHCQTSFTQSDFGSPVRSYNKSHDCQHCAKTVVQRTESTVPGLVCWVCVSELLACNLENCVICITVLSMSTRSDDIVIRAK